MEIKNQKSKIKKLGILIIILLLIQGCAKTVTPIVTFGEQMIVTVTLRGNFDVINNRYFLVLASSASLNIPLPPPDNIEYEMIEPGTDPISGSEEAYYLNYYSTWNGYSILEPGGYYLVAGPFVQNQTNTRESLGFIGNVNKTIVFNFDLSKVFGTTIPGNIYFDVVTVDWPDGHMKLPYDHLTSTNAYISKVSGSVVNIDDGQDAALESSLDIISCKAEIE